jgi:MFS family permease
MAQNHVAQGLRLLKNKNVNRMFVAYLISYTGTAMAPIAMAFGVLELTGSAADAAFVIAAPTAASIVVLLLGGVVADRTSRQRVMILAEITAMAAQCSMAALFISDTATVPLLTACMLVNGLAVAFHAPAATGLIVQLVPKNELQATNALLGIARNSAVSGGAALGGLLVATTGPGITLLIDGLSFGFSALLVMFLRPVIQPAIEPKSVFRDLQLGWQEFTRHTWLWTMVLQFSLVVAAAEAIFGLLGPAVTRDLMGGAFHWGLIASAHGVGTLLGGLLAMQLRPQHPMYVATCCVFFFAGVPLTLSVPLQVAWVVLAALTGGATIQVFSVLWLTTLQQKVPTEMLSRVSAYDHLGSIALAPLGIVAAGILYESIGYRTTLILAGLAIIIPTALALTVRDVREVTIHYFTGVTDDDMAGQQSDVDS